MFTALRRAVRVQAAGVQFHLPRHTALLAMLIAWVLAGCAGNQPDYPTQIPSTAPPAQVPELPFADNPDPTLCGIPERYGIDHLATVTGIYQGELVQPIVYLYDSHLRREISGQVYPGTRVRIELRQVNPTLNYYLVRTVDLEPAQSGWIPEPFLQFPETSGR